MSGFVTTPAALLAEDEESRRLALNLESFIVEAPAGAGKTELLTQRYLRLLAVVAEPEEIVALTFTNKAAAEMRNRIVDSLTLAAAGRVPDALHKRVTYALARAALDASAERGWKLLDQPLRLRIMTMDALSASLARQLPLLSRFGAQPAVREDAEVHYEAAARRLLARLDASTEDGIADLVVAALRYLDNDSESFVRLFVAMLGRRDQWLRHGLAATPRELAESGLSALIIRDLACAIPYLHAELQASIMAAARYAAANLAAAAATEARLAPLAAWTTPLVADPEQIAQWRTLLELLLTKDNKLRKVFNRNLGLPPGKGAEAHKQALALCIAELAAKPGAEAALARLRTLPEARYSAAEWHIVDVLRQLLTIAAAELWDVFRAAGEVDFVEVAQRALLALGEEEAPSDLALSLDYRVQHLLVDEFQDTSPTQVQLLARLMAGWNPGDGRTLFLVGDPMQSIYRFRKAEVGLFLNAAGDGEAGAGLATVALRRLRLYRNNRSTAPLVGWVNANFADLFPGSDDAAQGAIRYRPFVATQAEDEGSGVQLHPVLVSEGTPAAAGDLLEARTLLALIDRERADHPGQRIAVLVRSRRHLSALVEEIRRNRPELRFVALDIESLAARQVVQDLLALTRALCQRADRVAALGVLRAPWCGLTLADLDALAADDQESTLYRLMHDDDRLQRLSADGRRRLLHLRAALDLAYAQQGRLRLRPWVEGTWLSLGGAGCLCGADEIADAQAYFELLARLEAGGRFSLERLQQEVAKLYAAPDAQADGSLQFMTIHRAKGLEFDCVILPGLHRRGRRDARPLLLWEEVIFPDMMPHLVVAPLVPASQRGAAPQPYDYLRLLEDERAANEEKRVLYVAATRAARRLHLLAVLAVDAENAAHPPAGTFVDLLWQAFSAAAVQASPSPAAPIATDAADFVPLLRRVVAPANPFAAALPGGAAVAAALARGERTLDAADSLEASVGTLVHRYLELIARSGWAHWNLDRLTGLLPVMERWLVRQGHQGARAAEGASRVAAALSATLASEPGRWLLTAREDAAIESEWSVVQGAGVSRRVVDRSFVDAGSRWIIDYKTARVSGGEAQFAAHAERYRPQLEAYAGLYAADCADKGLRLRLAVFYVDAARLVELSA